MSSVTVFLLPRRILQIIFELRPQRFDDPSYQASAIEADLPIADAAYSYGHSTHTFC